MTLVSPVVQLKLADPRFYHLDTCFFAINEWTVAIYEGAFDERGLALIRHFFKNVISVSEKEALNFALNAVAIKDDIILQKGSPEFVAALKKYGFNAIEVDTSEFMKSGGSVFCMKMMVY
jgi:N-dimethylarginine dimethylaminohydrolase